MSAAEDLADANLIEAIREHARWQEPCELAEEGGALMMAGSNAFPGAFRNCMARVAPDADPEQVLERARRFFGRRGRGFTVLARESRDRDLEGALRAAGMAPLADAPCMVIEAPFAEARMPPGIRVARFADERQVRDAVEINAEAYQAIKLPAEEARMYFNRPAGLLSPRVVGFVAYEGTQPVATALTILSGAGAGIYWVGTLKRSERKGLGGLCTRLATNAGFAAGARAVALQASPAGEGLYRKLGYRVYDRLRRYRVTPS
jgi:ribosomal protein S18 acetylase RimI-like enzyme